MNIKKSLRRLKQTNKQAERQRAQTQISHIIHKACGTYIPVFGVAWVGGLTEVVPLLVPHIRVFSSSPIHHKNAWTRCRLRFLEGDLATFTLACSFIGYVSCSSGTMSSRVYSGWEDPVSRSSSSSTWKTTVLLNMPQYVSGPLLPVGQATSASDEAVWRGIRSRQQSCQFCRSQWQTYSPKRRLYPRPHE